MRCPYCKANNDHVVDSRENTDGTRVRRRRECFTCGRRWTTHDMVEAAHPGRPPTITKLTTVDCGWCDGTGRVKVRARVALQGDGR